MSTTKGAWKLQEVRDQILAGEWAQYDNTDDAGELWVWGSNFIGQLGDGTTIPKSSPIQIPGTDWVRANQTHDFNPNAFAIKCVSL
jgi:hypothetical protein